MCDDKMLFTDVLAGWPGSVHDSRVLRNSVLWRTAANKFPGDTHLLGDGGYPLSRYINSLTCTSPIAMFLVTSPIVINVPTRGLLAVETMHAIVQWLENLNIKRNMTSMFVNKKHRYRSLFALPLIFGI